MGIQVSRFSSPIGKIHLLAGSEGLLASYFESQAADMERRFPSETRRSGHGNIWLLQAQAFLACYFAGDFPYSCNAPLAPRGTPFPEQVWKLLETIPAGRTRTYGELAALMGRPSAGRAVGAANARNPLSIFVPCHRLIGASGKLTGYAGGLERKRFLLDHERAGTPQGERKPRPRKRGPFEPRA